MLSYESIISKSRIITFITKLYFFNQQIDTLWLSVCGKKTLFKSHKKSQSRYGKYYAR